MYITSSPVVLIVPRATTRPAENELRWLTNEIKLLTAALEELWDGTENGSDTALGKPTPYVCTAISRARFTLDTDDLRAEANSLLAEIRDSLAGCAFVDLWLRHVKGIKICAGVQLQDYRKRWIHEMIAQREAKVLVLLKDLGEKAPKAQRKLYSVHELQP